MRLIIDNYKLSNRNIGSSCRRITELLLVRLDGKRVYEGNEFESEQFNHRSSTKAKLRDIHSEIVSTMRNTFKVTGIVLGYLVNDPILSPVMSSILSKFR